MTNRRLFGLCGCLLALCLLVWPGLGQECDWEYIVEDNQTFHPDPSSVLLTRVVPVQYVEDCQKKCCAEAACHLAVLGFPQDGGPQCMMYNCQDLHRDVCVLHPNDQLKIYRKKVQAQPAELKKKLHVVQFIEQSWKRESNETNYVRCRLPKETGPCRASFQKFYYDVVNETCKSFIYGGCAGNDNNFDNKEECDAACRGVTGNKITSRQTNSKHVL
ncbi:hypothetical protein LDENG_00016360 [Lucifuga dentata]|nr:hypothetical protein LDENG_00016360 [Lucifuga dentata]